METYEAITSRRQVRSYTDQSIPEEALAQILEAGRRTPSGFNRQPWDIVVVTDEATKASLAQTWTGADASRRGATWTVEAPVVLALVVPIAEDAEEALTTLFDLGQLAMQLMITAAGLGVASGQASCKDQDLAREAIGFPEDRECALLLALGYPADRPLKPIANPSRRAIEDVVHRETW